MFWYFRMASCCFVVVALILNRRWEHKKRFNISKSVEVHRAYCIFLSFLLFSTKPDRRYLQGFVLIVGILSNKCDVVCPVELFDWIISSIAARWSIVYIFMLCNMLINEFPCKIIQYEWIFGFLATICFFFLVIRFECSRPSFHCTSDCSLYFNICDDFIRFSRCTLMYTIHMKDNCDCVISNFWVKKKHYKADEKNAIYSFELSVCVKNLHRYTNTVFD